MHTTIRSSVHSFVHSFIHPVRQELLGLWDPTCRQHQRRRPLVSAALMTDLCWTQGMRG